MNHHVRTLRIIAAFAALAALPACGLFDRDDPRHVVVVPPPPPPPQAPVMAPQAAPQMPMAQAPAPMAPAPMQAPQAQAMGSALAGHLASYRTAESAQAGWQQLVRAQPALQTLRPYYVPVTINGQPWVRLLAGDFPNAEEVNRFCNWARANRMYCMPMPVQTAAQPNAGLPQAAPAQRQRQPRGTPQPPPQTMAPAPAIPAPAPQSSTPMAPAPAAAPAPVMAAPAAPAAQPAANQPPQPLAPPLPARRQPSQPGIPQ
jgi:2-oxoglutarate dehydrogenase E2 component (dihydrolipoamide succinyltransferase)